MAQELSDDDWAALVGQLPYRGVIGVKTTGIFCRAGCPARRFLRRNVVKFGNRIEAEAEGFRACKRCWSERAAQSQSAGQQV